MPDGTIAFSITADDADAQKKLNQLRRDIEKTTRALDTSGTKKSGIAVQLEQARAEAAKTAEEIQRVQDALSKNSVELAGYSKDRRSGTAGLSIEDDTALREEQRALLDERQQLLALQKQQNAEVAKLEGQEQKITAQMEQQTATLAQQKVEAGEVERVLAAQSAGTMPDLGAAVEQVSKSMRKGFRNILKWGFGIRSTFILIRRLRSAIKEGVTAFAQHDEETANTINNLKSALSQLKISWGAAFAPILNTVAPILQKLIGWLVAAANAVQRFFAILGGKNTYKAVKANEALADSYGGAGGAAEKAEKQIMGFDEINKLNAESGGGGGGGGAAQQLETMEQEIDNASLAAKLAFAVKDVLFDWDDLTPEQIAEKAVAGLCALSGMFVGFMFGGIPGAIIGLAAGLAFGILLDSTIFNFDGQLDKNEIYDLLAVAIGGVGGATLGFMFGGPLGAAIGLTIGLLISFGAITLEKKGVFAKIDEWFAGVKQYFRDKIEGWKEVLPNDASGVAMAFILGLIDGLWSATLGPLFEQLWKWAQALIKKVKEFFGIASPSTVFAGIGKDLVLGLLQGLKNTWSRVTSWFKGAFDGLKQWWGNLSLGSFDLKLPHLTYDLITVPVLGTIPDPTTLHVDWYARGGIVDGATLIGAGEAGKEAIIPLERHTEWITMVADSLIDRILQSRRLEDYISNLPIPALAMGQVVPPRAITGNGSAFSDNDIERLVSGIKAAFMGETGEAGSQTIKLYLDGRQIAETVTKHQRRMERGTA